MSHVDSKKALACAVAAAIGFLAPAALAGTAQSQKLPSRAGQVTRPAEPAAKEHPKPPDAEGKSLEEKVAHYESVHRERMARIRRMLAIYQEKGDTEKVAELQTMRDKLEKRHANAMQKFREQMGQERWTTVERHMGGPSARAREVRNEHANENAAERDARKVEGKTEKKGDERPKPEKDPRSKEKPPGRSGGSR